MADALRAGILGVVQGITEFLPVSSDGHLVLTRVLLGFPDEGLPVDAVLHLGTFLAVLVLYRAPWQRLVRVLLGRGTPEDRGLLLFLVVATIPGAVVGFFASELIATELRSLPVTGAGFLGTAGLLLLADLLTRRRRERALTPWTALVVGLLQVLALLPGLSRSGATIAGAMLVGLPRAAAVEFSFLLALPLVGGAGAFGLVTVLQEEPTVSVPALLLGTLAAAVTGFWAMRFLLRAVRRGRTFTPFVVYLVGVGLLSLLLAR